MNENKDATLEKIVSLAKRRGFVFPGSEIYGGFAGTYDYGPYGIALKRNLINMWWDRFVDRRDDIYGMDAAILMNEKVWEASGHTGAGFTDPVVECKKGHRFRANHVIENFQWKAEDIEGGIGIEESSTVTPCPTCGERLGYAKAFNLMFETKVGAQGDAKSYLRPETAQGMFVNFKNVVDSVQPKLPFGTAQIGKAFRNEIAPRDFLFRTREFEQMEIEYFTRQEEWEQQFDFWLNEMRAWVHDIGIDMTKVHEREVPEEDRAHYSKRTIDFEYDFSFGRKELYGLAYRTNFDLANHTKHSDEKLVYRDEKGNELTPHVIEPTFGVDRTVLAVLDSAYTEDEMNDEKRVFLKLQSALAPVKTAVFPLLKNKPQLVEKSREIYSLVKKEIPTTMWDDNGNIGKRYRRQDEIGTPACVTIDFDTLADGTVTVRDRDTGKQRRVHTEVLVDTLRALFEKA